MMVDVGGSNVVLDEITLLRDRIVEASERIPDPVDRAVALGEASTTIVTVLSSTLRQARAAAIREAMKTSSATEVAKALGISRARLYAVLS